MESTKQKKGEATTEFDQSIKIFSFLSHNAVTKCHSRVPNVPIWTQIINVNITPIGLSNNYAHLGTTRLYAHHTTFLSARHTATQPLDGRTPERNDCERKYEQLVATVPVQGTGREFLCFCMVYYLFLSEGSASSNVVLMHTFR
uniref:Uncharacterized protein n=1 Tax=Caenorhabditis japonica TaxID=281687 RepID=A0A8R1E5U5_CAEJA